MNSVDTDIRRRLWCLGFSLAGSCLFCCWWWMCAICRKCGFINWLACVW